MEIEKISVEKRETRGKRFARRMRAAGQIPAILYGHGEESVSLSVPLDQFGNALRRGAHVVELMGDVAESALVRDVQFDPLGTEILHVDFTRVRAGETAQVNMRVTLKGVAAGIRQGGVIEHLIHEVQIACPIASIPEKLELNINSLELGQSMSTLDLGLPEGAKLIDEAEAIVVQCVEPTAEVEEADEATLGAAEPEVIGSKPEDEEESGKG